MGCLCCKTGKNYAKLDDPEYRTFSPLQHDFDNNMYKRRYPMQLIEINDNSLEKMKHFKIVFLGETNVGKTNIISQKISYKFEEEHTPTIEDYYVKVHRINVQDVNSFIHATITLDINEQMSPSNKNSIELSGVNRHKSSLSYSERYDNKGRNMNDLDCYHCVLDIQDTSGSIDFRHNINQWIWRSQIFVIVFDLSDRKTFDNLENSYISRIIELRECDQPPIILVGNKSDAVSRKSFIDIESQKIVSSPSNKSTHSTQSSVNTFIEHKSESQIIDLDHDDRRAIPADVIEELCNKYNIPYIECSAKSRYNVNEIFDISVKERLFHEAYHRSETFMAQRGSTQDSDIY